MAIYVLMKKIVDKIQKILLKKPQSRMLRSCGFFYFMHFSVTQLVEYHAFNMGVESSSLSGETKNVLLNEDVI